MINPFEKLEEVFTFLLKNETLISKFSKDKERIIKFEKIFYELIEIYPFLLDYLFINNYKQGVQIVVIAKYLEVSPYSINVDDDWDYFINHASRNMFWTFLSYLYSALKIHDNSISLEDACLFLMYLLGNSEVIMDSLNEKFKEDINPDAFIIFKELIPIKH